MPDFLYCLNSSTIRPVPILKKIEIAGKAGYTAIELWHDDIDAHLADGGTLAEIRHAVDDQNLDVPTTIYLKGWFETTGPEHAAELDECKRRMAQSVDVGAVHVIAGPPAGMADHDLGARNYRELLEIGLEMGVKPAMEFLGFVEDINTIEDALEIVTKADHPAGTVVLDPFHIFRGGGSLESIAKLRAEQIAIMHFNDTPDIAPAHPAARQRPRLPRRRASRPETRARSVAKDRLRPLALAGAVPRRPVGRQSAGSRPRRAGKMRAVAEA